MELENWYTIPVDSGFVLVSFWKGGEITLSLHETEVEVKIHCEEIRRKTNASRSTQYKQS